jgi:hypothetical protein
MAGWRPEPRGGVQGPQKKWRRFRLATPFGFRCSSTFTNFFKSTEFGAANAAKAIFD